MLHCLQKTNTKCKQYSIFTTSTGKSIVLSACCTSFLQTVQHFCSSEPTNRRRHAHEPPAARPMLRSLVLPNTGSTLKFYKTALFQKKRTPGGTPTNRRRHAQCYEVLCCQTPAARPTPVEQQFFKRNEPPAARPRTAGGTPNVMKSCVAKHRRHAQLL